MSKARLMIVEDDPDISNMLRIYFNGQGYDVDLAQRGSEALEKTRQVMPHLIVLDIMLPDIDGYEVCRTLRTNTRTSHIPVIFLTQKDERSDKLQGLELGADDYITKPFSPRVLIARIRAVLRRNKRGMATEDEVLTFDALTIHPGRHEVVYRGETIDLTYTEFAILHLLARRPGWVFTRYRIVDAIRGEHYAVTERAVDVQIAGLRKKLGDAGDYIKTVRGVGYKFVD